METKEKVIAIRLQNFMGFEDTRWIGLRRITLLYGWNSTGKSAIIRALLLLRQSLGSGQTEPLVFVSDNGADLGSFWRMIRGKNYYDVKPSSDRKYDPGSLRQMVFGFRCGVAEQLLSNLGIRIRNDDEAFIDLYLSFQWKGKVELSAVTLEAPLSRDMDHPDRKVILQAEWVDLEKGGGWYLSSNGFFEHKQLHYFRGPHDQPEWHVWYPCFGFESNRGFLPEIKFNYRKGALEKREEGNEPEDVVKALGNIEVAFNVCCSAIRSLFNDHKFRHTGPIRHAPRRTYVLSELSQHKWDASGQSAILDFLRSYDEQGSDAQKLLNKWLCTMGIGHELHIDRLKARDQKDNAVSEAYQINVFEGGEQPDINFRDVGYGASQVLPIILQALSAPEDALVIVEQPELHLHPEAQVVLADLFVTQAERGPRYLIETHSEHILLRLQRRIAEATLSERRALGEPTIEKAHQTRSTFEGRDLGLVFVTRTNGLSRVEYVQADDLGRLMAVSGEFRRFFIRDYTDSTEFSIAVAEALSFESASVSPAGILEHRDEADN